jgi:hypothetical protein
MQHKVQNGEYTELMLDRVGVDHDRTGMVTTASHPPHGLDAELSHSNLREALEKVREVLFRLRHQASLRSSRSARRLCAVTRRS